MLVTVASLGALYGAPFVGFGLGRYKVAMTITAVLVTTATFWPDESEGDDWRPLIYPFWLAGALGLTAAGTALRRRLRNRRAS